MKRVLEFNSSDESKAIFAAIHQALRFGRNMSQQAPGKAVLRQERDIHRELATVSEPDPVQSNDLICPGCSRLVMKRDPKARTLKADGGRVVLTQADIELIQERIDKGPWTGDAALEMADALDFLSAAATLSTDP